MKSWSVVLLLFCSANLSACSGGDNNGDEGNGSGELPAGNVTVKITPDKKTVLRNPLNGWVIYMGRGWDENFWTTEGYDNVSVPELAEPVKVSDYASTCYIRTSWSSLEPEEGKYIWKDPTARLTRLLKSVLDRGMRLSFRIVVDGRDQGLNTPQYVFDAGAHWYKDPGPTNEATALARKSPFPDDKIFQEKYTKFIEALAQEFNDPDKVDFIDAYGLGKWGEAHTMIYEDHSKKKQVFEWITDLYSRCFTKVPLVINYHRLIGAENTSGWGALDPETEGLLESAINKGYSLRHDAFGMNGYYQDWEKQFAARWNYKRPIIMEGGWIVNQHRYWLDPMGYREGHPEDVRQGEFDASAEARVNMMDFRAAKSIGADIEADYEQLKIAGGYDHNYVLNNSNGTLRKIAEVTEPESGRRMEVFSDAVGVQFYAGNFVESIPKGKEGVVYQKRSGLCLETQGFPDATHHETFPSTVLHAGAKYETTTIYYFSAVK